MATIAIVHIGLEGHLGPATRLGAVLGRQGHRVHAWAPAEHKERIEAAGTTFHAFEPVPVRAISGGPPGFAAMLAEATERRMEELVSQLLEHDAELVVHDTEAPWGMVAAEFLGLPRILSYTAFPAPVAAPMFPDQASLPPRQLVPAFPPGSEDALVRAARSRQNIMRTWGIDIGDPLRPIAGPDALTISYTTAELAGATSVPAGWRFVGPLLEPGPTGGAEHGRPLIYVSLGTFFNFVHDVYRAVIDALADQQLDVLISTGRGPVSASHLGPLPPNVIARDFVPAREVLSRAAVMISHCGASSVHEALLAGVPLVCMPQALDQFAWAQRVQALGAGRIVEETPRAISLAVRTLLGEDRTRRRARELGERLADYDGECGVGELVEEALGARSHS